MTTKKTAPKRHAVQKSSSRIGLLVVGMHRSGTSAVTKTISLLGAELPSHLMPAHAEFNAAGYWESQEVADLNDQILAAAGSCWDDVLPIDPYKLDPKALHEFKRRAEEILTQDFNTCRWFVLKDPRIGRLLRLWVPAVEAHGAQPRVVIPIRHPLEVADSLHRREGFSEDKSVYLWLRHTVDAIRDSRTVPRAFIFFDELMRDWRAAVKRLGSDLQMRWPKKPDSIAPMVEQFLDQRLRHHFHSGIYLERGGLVNRFADKLYVALCERAGGLEKLVDSIHEQLGVIERVFAPLQQDSNRKIGLVIQEKGLLGQEFEDKGRHVELLEKLIASKREQGMHLEEEFTVKDRHVERLTREVGELQAQRGRAQAQLGDFEQTVEQERAAHAALGAAFEDKVRRMELLTQEVGELQAQAGGLTHRVTEKEQQIGSLEQTLGMRDRQVAGLAQTVTDKDRHVELLTYEVGELQAQQGRAQLQLDEFEQTVERERATHAALGAAFEDKVRRMELLTQEVGELQAQVAGLTHAVTEKEQQIGSLEQTLRERDGQVAGLTHRVTEKEQQIGSLEQTLEERDRHVAGLAETVTEKEQHVERLTYEVGELQVQLGDFEQTVERERATHAALGVVFEDKVRRMELLTYEVGELQAQVTGLTQTVTEKEQQIGSLAQTLGERDTQVAGLTQTVTDKDRHVERLTQEVGELQTQIGELLPQLERAKNVIEHVTVILK